MKKTVTINISGIIFHIDEDAYDRLNRYMSRLKRHFAKMEGRDEIIIDIESRIAELLQEKIVDNKQVITIQDIEEIVKMMGEPSELEVDSENETRQESTYRYERPKRLYRDPENRILAGVSSGIAAYFNIGDPLWIRLLFVIATIVYGFGPIAYIVLWILVPKAITTAEKLEMRGEPVNISNIERSFRDEFDNVKGKFNEFADGAKESFKKKDYERRRGIDTIAESLGKVVLMILKVFAVIIGLQLVLTGLGLITGLIVVPAGLNNFSFFDNGELIAFSVSTLIDMVFVNHFTGILSVIALLLFVGIPLIMLTYLGIWLIAMVFGKTIKVPYLGISAFILWLAGLLLVAVIGLSTGMQFRHTAKVVDDYNVRIPVNKTLFIKAGNQAQIHQLKSGGTTEIFDGEWNVKFVEDDYIIFGVPDFSTEGISREGKATLEVSCTAKGISRSEAYKRARDLLYPVQTNDSTIFISTYYQYPPNEKLRGQFVELRLNLPIGQIVHFDEGLDAFFNENPSYYYHRKGFEGNTWIMTETGLKPYGDEQESSCHPIIKKENENLAGVFSHALSMITIQLIAS